MPSADPDRHRVAPGDPFSIADHDTADTGPYGSEEEAVAELERLRDRLSERLSQARHALAERAEHEERSRRLLEEMLRDPARYRFVRLPNADLGEGGCGVWQVRPRLGLIGMLCGWWHVKLSSGCPLAT